MEDYSLYGLLCSNKSRDIKIVIKLEDSFVHFVCDFLVRSGGQFCEFVLPENFTYASPEAQEISNLIRSIPFLDEKVFNIKYSIDSLEDQHESSYKHILLDPYRGSPVKVDYKLGEELLKYLECKPWSEPDYSKEKLPDTEWYLVHFAD